MTRSRQRSGTSAAGRAGMRLFYSVFVSWLVVTGFLEIDVAWQRIAAAGLAALVLFTTWTATGKLRTRQTSAHEPYQSFKSAVDPTLYNPSAQEQSIGETDFISGDNRGF